MTFWDVLFDNLVLVHVLLPCVAGVVVCLLPRRKTGIARFLVFQMSLLSVACGIAMLLRFDASQPGAESPMLAQMATFHVWQPVKQIPAIRLAVGVDGLNLWYLISLPWVVLSLLLWESTKREWGRRDFICLTWATAGTLLAFAARDLMLLATGASVAFLSILAWSRHTTNSSPRQQARSVQGLAAWGVATAAVFLFGAAVGGVSSLQMQEQGRTEVPSVPLEIDELVFGVPVLAKTFPRSQEVWRQQGSTIYLAWCAAALLCVGAVPMQEVLLCSLQRLTPAPRAIVLSGLIPIGGYLLARITLPMLGTIVVVGQGWITWPVLFSLVWHLAKTGHGIDLNEGVLRLTLSAQCARADRHHVRDHLRSLWGDARFHCFGRAGSRMELDGIECIHRVALGECRRVGTGNRRPLALARSLPIPHIVLARRIPRGWHVCRVLAAGDRYYPRAAATIPLGFVTAGSCEPPVVIACENRRTATERPSLAPRGYFRIPKLGCSRGRHVPAGTRDSGGHCTGQGRGDFPANG